MEEDHQILWLSSQLTVLDRLIFPPYVAISCLFLILWLGTRESWELLIAAGFAAGAIAHYFWEWRMKEIYIQHDTVYASTFRRTIAFPLSSVTDIESRGPRLAFLHLSELTPLGDRLAFNPRRTTRGQDPAIEQALERIRLLKQNEDHSSGRDA